MIGRTAAVPAWSASRYDTRLLFTTPICSEDEAGSYSYTLEGGAVVTENDPMLVGGTILTNDLQTFTTALTGSGFQQKPGTVARLL